MYRNVWPVMLLLVITTRPIDGADWPAFRGPSGTGVAAVGETAPTDWSPDKNIRWKTPLPGRGHSTPIIWNNRVFVTAAVPIGQKYQK